VVHRQRGSSERRGAGTISEKLAAAPQLESRRLNSAPSVAKRLDDQSLAQDLRCVRHFCLQREILATSDLVSVLPLNVAKNMTSLTPLFSVGCRVRPSRSKLR